MPLVDVLVTMQRNGITLDPGVLQEMAQDLMEQIGGLEERIYNNVGHRFTINSPQQLSEVLFGQLGLPKTKRTKTGYSTDANSLDWLRAAHPVVEEVLDYRQDLEVEKRLSLKRGLAAGAGGPGDAPDTHQLQSVRFGHGTNFQQRPELAEHSGENGAGPSGAPGVRSATV